MKIEELINKLKKINSLEELPNYERINSNALIYAIYKSGRYDLFKNNDIRLNLNDRKTLEELMDYFLNDEDILVYMFHNGFSFTKIELATLFDMAFQKYNYTRKLNNFFVNFLPYKFLIVDGKMVDDRSELNAFVKDHEDFFINYLKNSDSVSPRLEECDNFVELILKGNHFSLIKNIYDYSANNLKLLVNILRRNVELPYGLGNYFFAVNLFELKNNFTLDEFWYLLSMLKEKDRYDGAVRNSAEKSFSDLISENIDYLIELVDVKRKVPFCLVSSCQFRDLCIKKKRIDIAINCLLSEEIIQDEELVHAYCKELNISVKDFYERTKWILNYQTKNENIFNTFLATSLKTNIFTLKEEHFERFINDINIQMSLANLNDKELAVFKKILEAYNYQDYDITLMIKNIIDNIRDYSELINSLNITDISLEIIKKLVAVLQVPNNVYHIKDVEMLKQYTDLKKQYFFDNFRDLEFNKNNLLRLLFNIDLKEAQYIDYEYCHDNGGNNILDELKTSELPEGLYNYLELINRIVNVNNNADLINLYNSLNTKIEYDLEIPLENFLRAKYTELYSKSLYRIEEKQAVYGPKDSTLRTINYHGTKIKACIPREKLRLFVHCIGSCSAAVDDNYCKDWLDRPQLQDHFVACSYLNERGIFSLRDQDKVVLGFDYLEGGAILGMSNTDIDSIGSYANAYAGSRELQKENRARAKFHVPSMLLKTVNKFYSEVVIERRNSNKLKGNQIKRKPDYVIMIVDSLEQEEFNNLDRLFKTKLAFLKSEDKEAIRKTANNFEIKSILKTYSETITKMASSSAASFNEMLAYFIDLIKKAKLIDNSLKAASEFDVPVMVLDREYYFKKMLAESDAYDTETKVKIWNCYKTTLTSIEKREIFDEVAEGVDMTKFIADAESRKKIPEANQATSMKR